MSNVMEDFRHLDALTLAEIHSRYQKIKGDPGKKHSDEELCELLALARVLRKRSSAPTARKATSKTAPTLDAL